MFRRVNVRWVPTYWGMVMFSPRAKRRAFWLAYSVFLLTLSWGLVIYAYAD